MELATIIPTPIPHVTVEIRDTANRQLVTAIEVLSPTNKRGDGRQEYLAKRRRILLSTAHLLEIDLLRQGQRVPMQKPLPSVPYFIFLSRAEKRPLTEIWPISLKEPLPVVPIPLLPGDEDVALDVQHVFTTTYDLLGMIWRLITPNQKFPSQKKLRGPRRSCVRLGDKHPTSCIVNVMQWLAGTPALPARRTAGSELRPARGSDSRELGDVHNI